MQKAIRFVVLTTIFSAILIVACKKETAQEETKTPAEVPNISQDSLKIQVDAVTDSLNTAWNILNATDSLLHADMKRLLQEISYAKKYDVLGLKKMESRLSKLTAKRLTQTSMADSKLIDNYDLASDSLVSAMTEFAAATPNVDHYPLIKRLVSDINTSNSAQVIAPNRAHYDQWAKEFNLIVSTQEDKLKALGEPYASYKVRPLFTIAQ